MRSKLKTALLVVLLGAVLCGYVYAGFRQREYLNRSATAGGQHPYLRDAERMAVDGGAAWFGDHNRMPLVPALVSLAYVPQWTRFFDRATLVAIASGVVLLVLVAVVCFATLPRAPATFVTLLGTVCVFMPKASFVQAELAYYALFFAAWAVMCRVIVRPDWRWSGLAGVLCGLAFWAKASAWPLMLAFAVTMIVRSALAMRRRKRGTEGRAAEQELSGPASVALVAVIAFLLIAGPYLRECKRDFGRYLYNVNSTFFVWCDSWAEASAFAKRYDIEHHYPDAPPDEIPSASRYWQTHSAGRIAARFRYGASALTGLVYRSAYLKYLAMVAIVAGFVAWKRRRLLKTMRQEHWLLVCFCALVAGGYLTVYAWYALVAYGDRFVLSLVLPAAYALSWFVARYGKHVGHVIVAGRRMRLIGLTFALCSGALAVEGVGEATYGAVTADPAFVQFYFNESRAAQLDGHKDVAVRGYRGIIELDPTFAPAHHELGMIALREGRLDEALAQLMQAVHYRQNDPNMLNSLGSVLIQLRRLPEAVRALTMATDLDPNFVSAWYNLGVALHLAGDDRGAVAVVQRLQKLHPPTAARLRVFIQS